jgi:serpin B
LRANLASALVTLSLPKWTFESEHSLKAALQVLGMNAAFVAGAADLSGMDGRPGHIYIDDVYHKAFIAVDEVGTEAAAATAVIFSPASLPPHYTVAFDRPFVFLIYDKPTGQILFLGHLTDPG